VSVHRDNRLPPARSIPCVVVVSDERESDDRVEVPHLADNRSPSGPSCIKLSILRGAEDNNLIGDS
jgi:hypothetical protein